MKHLVFLVCLSSGLLAFTLCQTTQKPGDVVLPNCTNDFLDIEENHNNTILCEGFNQQDTVVWLLQRDGQDRTKVATCDPRNNCIVHQSYRFAVQRSSTQSLLFYQQYDRDLDALADVFCKSKLAEEKKTQSCQLNVINRATLSDCRVEMDTHSLFVTGSCRFEQAYSFGRGLTCIWYQKRDSEEAKPFFGTITTTSKDGHLESGVCNCSWSDVPTDQAASYTYTIAFYPGPGNITVPFGTTGSSTRPTVTSRPSQVPTEESGTSTDASTTSASHATTMESAGDRPTQASTSSASHGTIKERTAADVTTESNADEGGGSLPVAAVAGGIAAAVIVFVIVVVVVIVLVRRKRRQKPDADMPLSQPGHSKQDDDFEEHVNPMYTTSEDQDDTRHSGHNKPSAFALRISSNPKQHQPPTAPPSLEADLYSSVDGEDTLSPYNTADGGYEDIGFDGNRNSHTPETDDGYAVVDEPRSKPNQSSTTSAVQSTHNNHEYAVVDKRGKNNTARNNASSPANANTDLENGGTDVYAQVNKAGKTRKMVSESQSQGDTYAQIEKPKPAAKPKIPAKPSLKKEAEYPITADDDDEYRRLIHSRGIPSTQSQVDVESHYSHIGHV